MLIHVLEVWNLKIPPQVQFFLWLLSKNKVLTRYNLIVRKKVDDISCLFCKENESILVMWLPSSSGVMFQMWI